MSILLSCQNIIPPVNYYQIFKNFVIFFLTFSKAYSIYIYKTVSFTIMRGGRHETDGKTEGISGIYLSLC